MYRVFDILGPSIGVCNHLSLLCLVTYVLCFILQSGKQFGGPGKDKGEQSKVLPTEQNTDQEPELIPGLEMNNPWDLSHSKLGKTTCTTNKM